MQSRASRRGRETSDDAAAEHGYRAARRPRLDRDCGNAAQTLEFVSNTEHWRDLFEVAEALEEGGSTSMMDSYVHARSVRNRLLRIAHPDRNPFLHAIATKATANINRCWLACADFFAAQQSHTRASGAATQRETIMTFQNSVGYTPAILGPNTRESVAVEEGGSIEMLKLASTISKEGRPPAMLERPELGVFVGFGSLDTLRGCKFLPMATNRCISQHVVARRVAQNLDNLRTRGAYHDFGQIALVAVQYPTSEQFIEEPGSNRRFARFYVLDGQHRLTVMEELAQERPNVPIWFDLRVKVVKDKQAANQALLHMQHCYHPDPKCFFQLDDEADIASRVLDYAHVTWPGVFVPPVGSSWSAFAPKAPPIRRPKLDDGLFFDILRDTRLLPEVMRQTSMRDGSPLLPGNRPQVLFEALVAVNNVIRQQATPETWGVAASTLGKCLDKCNGCFLGLYRRDRTGEKVLTILKAQDVVPKEASMPSMEQD